MQWHACMISTLVRTSSLEMAGALRKTYLRAAVTHYTRLRRLPNRVSPRLHWGAGGVKTAREEDALAHRVRERRLWGRKRRKERGEGTHDAYFFTGCPVV